MPQVLCEAAVVRAVVLYRVFLVQQCTVAEICVSLHAVLHAVHAWLTRITIVSNRLIDANV